MHYLKHDRILASSFKEHENYRTIDTDPSGLFLAPFTDTD